MVILIATDGSPVSFAAARAAVGLAKQAKAAALHAIFVRNGYEESIIATAFAVIQEIAGVAGVTLQTHRSLGEPVAEILAYADRIEADVIAVGTHGRSGLNRLLLGSTFQALLVASNKPLFVVRGDELY